MSLDRWQWYTPTQAEVACSDASHWVRWEQGTLIPLNHSEGEQTLSALAGEKPACFDLMQLWNRHSEDLRVLALASRGPDDPLLPPPVHAGSRGVGSGLVVSAVPSPATMPATLRRTGTARRVQTRTFAIGTPGQGRPAGPRSTDEDPVARLLALAGPLADRLVATVAAAWADRLAARDEAAVEQRAGLTAALYGRTVSALRTWLGAPRLVADVTMVDEGESRAISRDEDGVRVSLPFSWIPQVYCRGLAVLLGHFVLGVVEAHESRIVLDAVGTDLQTTTRIHIGL